MRMTMPACRMCGTPTRPWLWAAPGPARTWTVPGSSASARDTGCDAVHPGYGFLSERADFAQACADAGLVFIGPDPAHLRLFGDKAAARAFATRCGVPLLPGTEAAVTLEEALAFFDAQGGAGVMVKAVGGGGGRGMRAVLSRDDLPAAYARCVSEARACLWRRRGLPRASDEARTPHRNSGIG